jgi:hypothetical protein
MTSRLARIDSFIDRAIKQMIGLQNALPLTTDDQLAAFGEKYGLAVVTDASKTDGEISFQKIGERQKRIAFELLDNELSLYDPAIVKQSQLQRLILCNDLRDQGRPVNGLAEVGRFVVDSLVLNMTAATEQWERARATLHHELFHAIDYRDDPEHYLDPEWRKLNGADYKYNDSLQFTAGEYFSNAVYFPPFDFVNLDKLPPGFLNEYGTESVHEDKAVVYSWMMVRYGDLKRIMERDEVVRAKVEYMKALLQRFHPSYDDTFWTQVEARTRDLCDCDYGEWKRRLNIS